ncbi:MAG: sigma-70 family RNA polymerase sigma factor [Planctomycetota bacterium]
MDNLNDALLVEQTLKGDKASFGELVKRYWPRAYHLCYQQTRNSAEAEETAQESFIKAYKYLGQLRDKSKFGAWFYQLALQLVIERRRKQQYRKTRQIPAEMEDKPKTDPMNKIMVTEALETLPDDFRLVLTLRFYQDMSCSAIAKHLGEPVGTVTSRLHRAYQALKEKLQ